MSAPLLATKLSVPPIGKYLVDRPPLAKKLDEFLNSGCRLALISAPAGYGKTTLLCVWITALKSSKNLPSTSAAWVSLDDRDNDPIVFWSYIITAIKSQHEGIGGQSLDLLNRGNPADLENSLILLINELNEFTNPFILILDDFHLIRNPAIHQSLAFLFEHTPYQFHLILASRTDPPLPLALLRGRGQLMEIRLNELRFSTEDADTFFNAGMGLNLSCQAVEALNQKTEGWITGLKLAALSLQEAASLADFEKIETFIDSFSSSNRYILDYLIEEVLNQQAEGIRNFLLRTSILDRFSGPLCEALFVDQENGSYPSSLEVLDYLDSKNLFLIPLDKERHWYRYHRLFADLLRNQLIQRHEKVFVMQLHQRASNWYLKNGFIPEAVDHALAADDFPQAAKLSEKYSTAMFVGGEWTTLLGWMKRLPENLIYSRPWLCINYAWALIFTGQLKPVESLLHNAEELIQHDSVKSEDQDILGNIAVIRARAAARHGEYTRAFKLAQKATTLLPKGNLMARSAAEFVKGESYFEDGTLAQALGAFSEAGSLGEAAGNLYVVIPAITETAKILKIQGNLRKAAGLYRHAIEILDGMGAGHPRVFGPVCVGYGDLLRERNDLPSAYSFTSRGIEASSKYGNTNTTALGYATLAWILRAQGDLAGADKASLKSIQLTRDVYPRTAKLVIASQISLSLTQGNLLQAISYLEEFEISPALSNCFANDCGSIALARVWLAQGKWKEALGLLDRLLEDLQTEGCFGQVIQVQNLRAIAFDAMHERSKALEALETSLALAEPEGYVRSFVDEGASMANLLALEFQRGKSSDYARCLLAAFPALSKPLLAELDFDRPAISMIESLTAREIDVLQLIAAGLTNKEIALKLWVSLRTVKYYTTNIYTKLDVNSRAQAAIKAKDLGLIK